MNKHFAKLNDSGEHLPCMPVRGYFRELPKDPTASLKGPLSFGLGDVRMRNVNWVCEKRGVWLSGVFMIIYGVFM